MITTDDSFQPKGFGQFEFAAGVDLQGFGTDWYLGDLVTVKDASGTEVYSFKARVTGSVFSISPASSRSFSILLRTSNLSMPV